MKHEKSIEVLNSLITINNDRIEGYETASKSTEEQDLNRLFGGFIQTSQKCRQELTGEVNKLGGQASEGTKTSGKFFRAWMDVKAALTGKDRKTILNSCEYGEDQAVKSYNNALRNNMEDITTDQQTMLRTHRASIKADREKVTSLRDAFVKA